MNFLRIISFIFAFVLFFALNASPARAVVDLAVSSITFSPESPAKGQPVTITVKILNNGDEAIFKSTGLDEYKFSAVDFDQISMSAPSASASAPLNANGTLNYVFKGSFYSIGDKNVSFQIDYYDRLDEWRETNNSLFKKATVKKPYDLSISAIELIPAKPATGQDCYITVSAKNSGYSSLKTGNGVNSISYTFNNFVEKSRELPVVDTINNVESGDTFKYVFYGYFESEGEQALNFEIDVKNQLDESDEDNNSFTKDATVVSPLAVDLSIDSIAIDKSSPILNDEIVITVTVKNSGLVTLISDKGFRHEQDLSVYPTVPVEIFFQSDNFKQTAFSAGAYPSASAPLEPGEKYSYKYTGQLINQAGEHTFNFRVNTLSRLTEEKYDNNAVTKTIYVYESAAERDSFELSEPAIEFYSATSARLSWQTTKKAASYLEYKRSTFTGWNKTAESTDLNHVKELKGLTAGQVYDYWIYASYGTVDREKTGRKFDLPDDNAVKVSAGPKLQLNGKNITASWQTDRLAKPTLYYRLKGSENYTAKSDNAYSTKPEFSVENLAYGVYEYYAVSKTNVGTRAETSVMEFTLSEATAAKEETAESGEADGSASEAGQASGSNASESGNTVPISSQSLYQRLRGQIILTVEQNGEAYYINPLSQTRHFLGRPDDAFAVMREQGIGITNEDLYKIPVGEAGGGEDSDGDGLSDYLEETIGLKSDSPDSDGDGFGDGEEISGGYNPWGAGKQSLDSGFAAAQAGKILLQVEQNGEAWYVSPADNRRYFLGRPADAFAVMRELGLGISDADFEKL